MPYLDDLIVSVVGKRYILVRHFRYQTRDGEVITAPKGMKTDFASIPRVFRFFITGHDRTRKAAVIHDYLYHNAIGTRKRADRIFLEALEESGVSSVKRRAMYWAVRIGGRGSW